MLYKKIKIKACLTNTDEFVSLDYIKPSDTYTYIFTHSDLSEACSSYVAIAKHVAEEDVFDVIIFFCHQRMTKKILKEIFKWRTSLDTSNK